MELTFEALKSRKKPRTEKVRIVLDQEPVDAYLEAKEAYDRAQNLLMVAEAQSTPNKALVKIRKQEVTSRAQVLDGLKAGADEAVAEFVFQGVNPHRVEELIEEHPPTAEQLKSAKAKGEDPPQYNSQTFLPALVALTLKSPKLSVEQVMEIWDDDDWNDVELGQLATGAMSVLQSVKKIDFLGNA